MNDLERLGKYVARQQDEVLAGRASVGAARDRFLSAVPRAGRPRMPRLAIALAACFALVVGVVIARRPSALDTLRVSVGGEPLAEAGGSRVEAPLASDVPLTFSDGSRLQLQAGGSVMLRGCRRRARTPSLSTGS